MGWGGRIAAVFPKTGTHGPGYSSCHMWNGRRWKREKDPASKGVHWQREVGLAVRANGPQHTPPHCAVLSNCPNPFPITLTSDSVIL